MPRRTCPKSELRHTIGIFLPRHEPFCYFFVQIVKCSLDFHSPDDPLAGAKVITGPLEAAGNVRGEMYAELYGERRFFLRREICPGCGTQLEARVTMTGAPLPGWRLHT